MTPKPTAELSEILEAIGDVPLDRSESNRHSRPSPRSSADWGRYKDAAGQTYQPMIIVVTDEVGNDEGSGWRRPSTWPRRGKCRFMSWARRRSSAGKWDTWITWIPRPSEFHRDQPVRQGPESAMLEQIRLPFWYDGPQYDLLEAGFGPYALSRLARASGGIYFVTRFTGRRMGFDPSRMREYAPDWTRRDQYEKAVLSSPLRQAVINAAQITNQQKLPGMPTLFFPPVESPEFKEFMAANQAIAERTAYTVEEALRPISEVAKWRDRETSRRWQAHYDLIRGRLLAMKIRCFEYNWACAG